MLHILVVNGSQTNLEEVVPGVYAGEPLPLSFTGRGLSLSSNKAEIDLNRIDHELLNWKVEGDIVTVSIKLYKSNCRVCGEQHQLTFSGVNCCCGHFGCPVCDSENF